MQMVDDGKLKTTPAVELSYLTPEEQEDFPLLHGIRGLHTIAVTGAKAQRSQQGKRTDPRKIQHIMAAKPPSVKPRDPQLMIPVAKLNDTFRKGFTSDQMQQVIVKTAGKLRPRPPARQQMRGTDDKIISC